MIENPPWVTKFLNRYWDQLTELVGHGMMPIGQSTAKGKIVPEEFGSGHYGTVMPTEDGTNVIKITSDPSEALFVAAALSLDEQPHGIIPYHRIVALPETHKKRPVFVIWRVEAFDVGYLTKSERPNGNRDAQWVEAQRYVGDFLVVANVVKNSVKQNGLGIVKRAERHERWAFEWVAERYELIGQRDRDDPWRNKVAQALTSYLRGEQRVAAALRFLEVIAESMHHNNPITTDIGNAFEFYLEKKILLADVHLNNIGKMTVSDDHGSWEATVVTDPGHAVFLTEDYDSITIPTLGE